MSNLRLVANNDLSRFPLAWRRGFADGRKQMRVAEAAYQVQQGNMKEADRQWLAGMEIRP
jgi:hypothetical protein